MFTFATDYYLSVFIATIGALQFVASLRDLRGLLFFKNPIIARALGLGLLVGSGILFFGTEFRNINDYEGGVDAPAQGLFFTLASASGLIVTLVLSSAVNYRMRGPEAPPDSGLDSLRDTNYILALVRSISYWRKNWRTQTKRYFFG